MPQHDLGVILDGLRKQVLSLEQACALFSLQKDAAYYFLTTRLPEILKASDITDKEEDSPSVRVLEAFCRIFGIRTCIAILPLQESPLVERFFRWKLRQGLKEFTDEDLILLGEQYREKPLAKAVGKARARLLVPIANQLLKNPLEINKDLVEVQKRISAYNFIPELNEVLDKVEIELAGGGDSFDQAASLKHLRCFFEKLHEQAALRLRAVKPNTVDGTDLTKCQQVIDFLQRQGVLTTRMQALARALYGVLSEEGVHALKSEYEYVRLCRNWIGEYALVLFFELDRRLM